MRDQNAARWASGALLVSCVLLLFLLSSRQRLSEQNRTLLGLTDGPLQGRWFPVVGTKDIRGDSICIGNGAESPQFVFLFTAACAACATALQAWAPTVDSLLKSGAIRAVGVALDPDSVRVRSFVAVNKPPMPIVQLVHPRWMDVFDTRVLPMMVVLDPDGRVRASRGGVPSDALIQDSIVPHLGQLLPTISPLLVRSTGCVE